MRKKKKADVMIVNNEIRKYKHNYKITKEDEKAICLDYLFNKSNVPSMLKKYNISETTYYNIVRKNKEDNFMILDEELKKIRENFSKKTSILISKALDRINEELESGKDIDINKLATLTGILYDKESLELGKSTSNTAFSINIKVDK